jgi:transmembrane sensor
VSQAQHDEIVHQASEWLVRLSEDDPTPGNEDRAAFVLWKNADPRHAEAFSKLENMVTTLRALPAKPARSALRAVSARRRKSMATTKSLALAALLLLPLVAVLPDHPVASLLADQRSATGEWRRLTLDDGSRVTLAPNSAVDLDFTADKRGIELLHGEIHLDVAADAARPLLVTTDFGAFEALGTRFTVRNSSNSAVLTVLESRVAVHADALAAETPVLDAGMALRVRADGVDYLEAFDPATFEADWQAHRLVVLDRPLPEVLEQLARYHAGYLRYNEAALADLRVSAVLPLDEPQRALQLLAQSFPIQLEYFTHWWVVVEPAPGDADSEMP